MLAETRTFGWLCVFHGFRDTTETLYDDLVRVKQFARDSGDLENFAALLSDQSSQPLLYFFHDANKSFLINKSQ